MRWPEEVVLLQEEMRRVLEFLLWSARQWKETAGNLSWAAEDYREGLIAYAECQASIRLSLRDHFIYLWRYVPEYVKLGVDVVEGEGGEDEFDDDDEGYDEEIVSYRAFQDL
jgi:hypothetical protein